MKYEFALYGSRRGVIPEEIEFLNRGKGLVTWGSWLYKL